MPRLPAIKPKDLISLLERIGFVCVRQRGSHRIFNKENLNVTVPYHNKDLRKKTLRTILRQADIDVADFIKLLKK